MGNAATHPRVYSFGPFQLDTRTGELSRNGVKTQLREQPLQLLIALLEQPGELVTREELVSRLWPAGTFVDFERGLNKAVNKLREVLGDSAEQPRYIETLPRKGYRLIAQVSADGAERSSQEVMAASLSDRQKPAWQPTAVLIGLVATLAIVIGAFNVGGSRDWIANRFRPAPRISSLAVIPLENLSRDPEQDYFADGMTDALITDLAKMGAVRVTSRASVTRYKGTKKPIKEIARELNVDAIVEGTVMRSGDRVRITAQLIQSSTDMHLWAETYEQDLREILDLQRRVATDIARRVNIVVRPPDRARTVQPEAYGLYLKGRYAFFQYTDDGWQRAIEHFTRAIETDPQFALAYAGLADTYLVAGAYLSIPPKEALTRSKAASAKALELDPGLAHAHYALATSYAWYDWDWAAAEREFRRALELEPNDALGRMWYGGYLSLRGRHDEAIDQHQRAVQLDPSSLIANANLARALYWSRRYDDAIRQAKATLQIDPKFGVALFWMEGALRHRGLFPQAVALRMSAASPERAKSIESMFKTQGFDALMREGGERFKQAGAFVEAARCFAQIGQKQEALTLLETCYDRKCSSMAALMAEPDFDVLRDEPRFQTLARKMGLQ